MVSIFVRNSESPCRHSPNRLSRDLPIVVSIVFDVDSIDTPGPGEYAVPSSTLLNQDPNKHFGFLEKSDRFRAKSKGISAYNFKMTMLIFRLVKIWTESKLNCCIALSV
jgi:hypothetical protein